LFQERGSRGVLLHWRVDPVNQNEELDRFFERFEGVGGKIYRPLSTLVVCHNANIGELTKKEIKLSNS
jgi:hypothetical protein